MSVIDSDRIDRALEAAKDRVEHGHFASSTEKQYFTYWYVTVKGMMRMNECHNCLEYQEDVEPPAVIEVFCNYMLGEIPIGGEGE